MAKVVVRYNIHPWEKGKLAVSFIKNKFKNNSNVRFYKYSPKMWKIRKEELQYFQTHSGGTKDSIKDHFIGKTDEIRKKVNNVCFESGKIPVEVHTMNACPPPHSFTIVYTNGLYKKAIALSDFLKKQGYSIGEDLVKPVDGEHITIELPGQSVKKRNCAHFPISSGNAYVQTLGQLRISKRFLVDALKFLEKQ